MRILALDQATQSGWAFGDEHSFEAKTVDSGIFRMPKRPFLGERLLIFGTTLNELMDFHKPDLIAYERPYWPQPRKKKDSDEDEKSKVSVEVLQFLQKVAGILEFMASWKGLPYESYASSSWRKTAVGYGYAPPGAEPDHMKKAMVRKARILGYDPKSFDQADAIGILLHALHGPPANARAQIDLLEMAKERL